MVGRNVARWPSGVVDCPRCGNDRVYKLSLPYKWQCKGCAKNGYRFSPLTGTIFENTNIKLPLWFQAILIICGAKKGISALQTQRLLGVGSYRTAWYGAGAKPKKAKRRPRKRAAAKAKARVGPLSLYPLDFETALKAVVNVPAQRD